MGYADDLFKKTINKGSAPSPTVNKPQPAPAKSSGGGYGSNLVSKVVPGAAPSAGPTIKKAYLPAWLGGGAYNIDKLNPNKVINTGHTTYAGVPAVKGMERDDTVPVSLGGDNEDPLNIKMVPMKVAAPIDKEIAKVAAEYKKGNVSLAQARLKILQQKQYADGGVFEDAPTQSLTKNFFKSLFSKDTYSGKNIKETVAPVVKANAAVENFSKTNPVSKYINDKTSAVGKKIQDFMFPREASTSAARNFVPALLENLPFGVGSVIKNINEATPEELDQFDNTKAKEWAKFTAQGLNETAKGFAAAPFRIATQIKQSAGGSDTMNLPWLGEVKSYSGEVQNLIDSGTNPIVAIITQIPNIIFDTIFVAGALQKVSSPRESTILTSKNKAAIPSNRLGPLEKSFRETPGVKPTYVPIENSGVGAPVHEALSTNGRYNSKNPTYLKIEATPEGFKGSIVQIKPSLLRSLTSKLFNKEGQPVKPIKGEVVVDSQELSTDAYKQLMANKAQGSPVQGQVPIVPPGQPNIPSVVGTEGTNIPLTPEVAPTSVPVAPIEAPAVPAPTQYAQNLIKQTVSNQVPVQASAGDQIPQQTTPAPTSASAEKELEPLAQVAAKYKTADEFLKSNEAKTAIEYHGTSSPAIADAIRAGGFKVGPGQAGVSTTQDYDEALTYSNGDKNAVVTVYVKPGAKTVGVEGKDFLTGTGSFTPQDLVPLPKDFSLSNFYKQVAKPAATPKTPTLKTTTKTENNAQITKKEMREINQEAARFNDSEMEYSYKKFVQRYSKFHKDQPLDDVQFKRLVPESKDWFYSQEFTDSEVFDQFVDRYENNKVTASRGSRASVGDYADTPVEEGTTPDQSGLVFKAEEGSTKGTFSEVPVELGGMDKVKPAEMPEIVKLARELSGKFPNVVKMRGAKRGHFIPQGSGLIELNRDVFADPMQAAKTLAHEIGHLVDYLPDGTMARGNLLGRLHTLRKFMKSTFAKELPEDLFGTRSGPLDLKKIKNEAFKDTLARKGIAYGKYITDKKLRDSLKEDIKADYDKHLAEIVEKNNVNKQSDIAKELKEVSKYWRPWDPETAPASFAAYRNSSEELYADALSVLLNSPGTLERMASKFYKAFFENLDLKPEVKESYFGLQELLNGAPEDVLKYRQQDIRKGFERAEALQKEFEAKRKLTVRSLWDRFRQQLDDINWPLFRKIRQAESRGAIIPDEENPKFILEENSLVDNENFLMIKEINDEIVQPLEKEGLIMDDLGEYLLLQRIKNERTDIANPFGHTPKTAEKQLEHLKEQLGPKRFDMLAEKLQKFHDIIFRSVEEAARVGSYNMERFETTIKPNKDHYASFAVVDYLQDYIPATIKAQHGTLKEVANPFQTTILKTVALNRLNAYQRAKNGTRDFLQKEFPQDIEKSKTLSTDGKLKVFKTPSDKGRIEIMEDGKMVGYDVDPYIAEIFEKSKVGDLNVIVSMLSMFNNKFFKPVVTTYNLGFAAAFNPIRDIKRNYKLIPRANFIPIKINRQGIKIDTVGNLISAYIKALRPAIRYTRGEVDEITKAMVESKAIEAPMGQYSFDDRANDHYNDILKRFKIIPEDAPSEGVGKYADMAKRTILKPVVQVLEGIRFIANTLEINSKIAGYSIRKATGESGKQLAANVRNATGTPNYRIKGKQTSTTNEIWVFSNIFKEGFKEDFRAGTNPNTRSGYWWKTVKVDLMPKLLMMLAAAGVLGETLKEFFGKASEYDKTNYLLIPLGFYEEGGKKKASYIRIPHDETGRLVSAIFWKMGNLAYKKGSSEWQDIISIGAGQLPSVTPAASIITGWTQYLSGKNPYDAFRGRPAIDDTTWKAGGGAVLKKMVQWTTNQLGLTSFATYDNSSNTGLETFIQTAPFFKSLIKITDYGEQESLRNETSTVKSQAQTSLKRKEVLKEYAPDIEKVADITSAMADEIGQKIYGDEYDKAKQRGAIKTSLMREVLKGDDNPFTDQILSSTSNKAKIKVLSAAKAKMDEGEYKDFTTRLVKFKVVSAVLLRMVP